MDNYAIADQLSLLSKLMDIHGENAFKAKSYANAAFAIEKAPTSLASLSEEQIAATRGIGDSTAKKIKEILDTGNLQALQDLLQKTPAGVLEMMNIKGLGPKKINTIWKELHINTVEGLKEACQKNIIAEKKGFGEKTQQNILEAIHFLQQNIDMVYIVILMIFLGIEIIGRVPSVLHTPLMSGANAIHGVVIIGAIIVMGKAETTNYTALILGFLAVVLGTLNVVGGFVVTDRMLEMFKKKKTPKL